MNDGAWIRRVATLPLLTMVRMYQWTLRPLLGGHCRFTPSCSEYAVDALKHHGPVRASWLITKRVCRCHPFGSGGYDPVPIGSDDRTKYK